MTSRLHFELFMRNLRTRTSAAEPSRLVLEASRLDTSEDVGTVRLSHIESAIRESRADRSGQ